MAKTLYQYKKHAIVQADTITMLQARVSQLHRLCEYMKLQILEDGDELARLRKRGQYNKYKPGEGE